MQLNKQQKEAIEAMDIDQIKYLVCVEMHTINPSYLPDQCEEIVEILIRKAASLS